MTLEKEFEKNTCKAARQYIYGSFSGYNDDYVKWLERRAKLYLKQFKSSERVKMKLQDKYGVPTGLATLDETAT